MTIKLNPAGASPARSLIGSGKIDRTSAWSISADEENAILGSDDWTAYSAMHLGEYDAEKADTKARYRYPFGKGGKLYRSALMAIRQRSAQNGATDVYDAAGKLVDLVDKGKGKSAAPEFEFKAARFEYKFTETGPETKGAFEGYGSVFNQEDDGGDLIVPGAFKQTLLDHDKNGTMPKMLLNHGGLGGFFASPAPEDLLPIGKWNHMSEDSHGLVTKGRLINLDTEHGKRIYGAMKENALDGLSIGYQAKQWVRGTRANEPERTLKQVHLIEVSPVTFPMNGAAMISSVKSIDFADLKGAEDLLREAAGFTRAQATGFLARVRRFQQQGEPAAGDEMKQLIAAISRRTELLRT